MGRFLIAALCMLCVLAPPAMAQIETKAQFAILVDAESGATLFEKSADALMAPASMSKLMTLTLIFEALEAGKITPETMYSVSEYAWRTGGGPSGTSAMFVPLNSSVSVGELLQGIIVQSGNDACIVMAEGLAGSEAAFATQMNDAARRLGLPLSRFVNSTGLPDPEQRMTARELAQLAQHIIRTYPARYGLFAQREFKYRTHPFVNRNPLIYANIGADGLKTGQSEESGFGIVGSSVQNGQRLIVVLNGLKSNTERRDEAIKLLNWGYRNFQKQKIYSAGDIVADALVWGGSKRHVDLQAGSDVMVLVSTSAAKRKVSADIVYRGPLKPPIRKGDQVATLRVRTDDGVTNTAPLYAAEDIAPSGVLSRGFDSLLTLAFGWLL